jgi:ribose-phosphate pyrophosphokinase
LLEAAGVDWVVTLDVHNPAALDNSFSVPVDHLSALPMMVDHFGTRLGNAPLTVASPDIGGVKRAQIFRELLESRLGRSVELAFFEKRRADGIISGHALIGDVRKRTVIIVDDLCATGNTLIRATEASIRAGCEAVYAAVTHTPHMPGIAAVLAEEGIAGVVTTDSVGFTLGPLGAEAARKLTVLSIAPLFAEAVRRMLAGMPLAPLLAQWPLTEVSQGKT